MTPSDWPEARKRLEELIRLIKADAVVAALDRIDALEAEVARLREALDAIKNGRINTDFVMSDPPDWHSAFGQQQAIARRALQADIDTPEKK